MDPILAEVVQRARTFTCSVREPELRDANTLIFKHDALEVRDAGGYWGQGVFAAFPIPAGTLIVVEEPLLIVPGQDLYSEYMAENLGRIFGAISSRRQVGKFSSLRGKTGETGVEIIHGQGLETECHSSNTLGCDGLDLSSDVHSGSAERDADAVRGAAWTEVITNNVFGATNHACMMVYEFASMLNHSCIPNVAMAILGHTLVMWACVDVDAGEQLCHRYVYCKALENPACMSPSILFPASWSAQIM